MGNIEFARQWFEEVWNKGNVDHIDKCLADDCCVDGLHDNSICNPAEFHAFHKQINDGYADIHCTMVRAIENGDDVSGFTKVTATHKKSGKPVEFCVGFIGSIRDGKFREVHNTINFHDVLIQVGAMSPEAMGEALG